MIFAPKIARIMPEKNIFFSEFVGHLPLPCPPSPAPMLVEIS